MTTLIEYNSPEYSILLKAFENTKLDKWIATTIESFIYEWKEERYKNGNLKCRYLTRFGEKDGEYKMWRENGQLLLHCNYKEGKREESIRSGIRTVNYILIVTTRKGKQKESIRGGVQTVNQTFIATTRKGKRKENIRGGGRMVNYTFIAIIKKGEKINV